MAAVLGRARGAAGPSSSVTRGNDRVISVLLVDDDEEDYIITRDMLEQQDRARFALDWCSDFESAVIEIGKQHHDAYLVDYNLGENTGLDLVRTALASRPAAPVIILTGRSDYEVDLEAAVLGVTDFLLKQELNPFSLERSIRYAINHQHALSALERSEERYALAARAVNDGIWDWDLQSGSIFLSPRFHALLGRADLGSDSDPSFWFDLVHEDDLARLRTAIDAHLEGRTSHLQSEHRMRHSDGTWRWVLTRGLAVRDGNGEATRMAGSLSDITERRRAEGQLQHDAFHDSLTGLPNRALFVDRLEHALRHSERDSGVGCAVLFLDIDRFKLVNDSFSHAVGDRLLILSAERIAEVLRPGDTVARIGGDEFTILVDDIGREETAESATQVAQRVQEALSEGFDIDENRLFVTASIGISLSSTDLTAADLLRNADIAMYEAKRRGRAGTAVFDQSMHQRVAHRLRQENDLREVVEQSLLDVHYQPIVELSSGRVHGFEALARWPKGWAPVPPAEFIPVAEETGLIGPLGLQVLGKSLRTLAFWRRSGLIAADVMMSVNVSARQLDDPRFPEDVLAAISAAGVPGHVLRLEITEGTLMREPERMARFVSEVCATGVGLDLDDYGTGYSSLTALREFPVNALKIDRSFIATLTDDVDSEVIVRSTVALAHSLGLKVIAEGIEHPGQLRRLRSLGCEYGQGYLFSTPGSGSEIAALLAKWSPVRTVLLADVTGDPAEAAVASS
jgi:diguanylate cyclase (GGDEF)-like protein/PAS domain S-box-containing protein